MNTELLTKVINWLEAGAPERRFNMGKMIDYDDPFEPPPNWCGTTCCIAGYVWQQGKTPLDIEGRIYDRWDDIEKEAAIMLDLPPPLAHHLFYPHSTTSKESFPGDWEDITPGQAAQAIRNLITYGEPHWEDILDFEEGNEE